MTPTAKRIIALPVDALEAGENDRQTFDAVALQALADSITRDGLAQPITVRPIGDGRYSIVAGERRWRAHELAGLPTIAAIVRNDLDDESAAAIMLLENVQRQDLNPIDEANAYHKRMQRFAWTVTEIAKRAQVSSNRVKNRLALLDLVPEVQKLIADGHLSPGYGVALADLDSNRQRIALRYVRQAKRPNLPDFRLICGELLAEQAQESMFDLDRFLVATNDAIDDAAERKANRRFPVDETLPLPVNGTESTGKLLENYIADLLLEGHKDAAAVVGRLYQGFLQTNHARPPDDSPLDTLPIAMLTNGADAPMPDLPTALATSGDGALTYGHLVDMVERTLQSAATKRAYHADLRAWGVWAQQHGADATIPTFRTVRAYISALADAGSSRAVIRRRVSAIRKLARVAVAVDCENQKRRAAWETLHPDLLTVPVGDDGEKRHKRALTPAETDRALRVWADDNTLKGLRNHALIATLFCSGARRSEVARLRWSDIDLEARTAHVLGKGSKERDAPLGCPAALRALEAWRAAQGGEREFVFCSIRKGDHLAADKPLSPGAVCEIVTETSDRAGVEFSTHDTRRTYITEALATGHSLADTQADVGHGDGSTTLLYAQARAASERAKDLALRYG